MTDGKLVQTDSGTNRRYAPRYALRLLSQGTDQANSFDVCIQSISVTGVSIEVPLELAVGSRVEIALPGSGATQATVIWSDGMLSGCLFDAPISSGVLSAARLKGYPVTAESAVEGSELLSSLLVSDARRWPGSVRLALVAVAAIAAWGLVAGIVSALI